MAVGTIPYFAPEQLMGEEIDGHADQYALAATTYHLLTGSQLFPHFNPAVVISRHLNSPPPALAETRPELAPLDVVLSAALAKDPNDRYSRCADFAHALAEQSRAHGAPPPAAPTKLMPTPRRSALAQQPPPQGTTSEPPIVHASRRSWLVPLAAAAAILALQAQTGQPASEFGGVVVKELLDNALDAAEKGDEALFVEIVTRTEGEITFVTVTKNGAGIGASRGTRSDCEYDQP